MKTSALIFGFSFFLVFNCLSQQFQWAKQFAGRFNDRGVAVEVDEEGKVYTAGNFQDSIDCDPSSNSLYFHSTSFEDHKIFITKLDSSGDLLWAKTIGQTDDFVHCEKMALDDSANIYIAGYFLDTVDFDPGVNEYNLYSDGWYSSGPIFINADLFLLKLQKWGLC